MVLELEARRGHSRWDTEGVSMELALALQSVFCSGTVVVSREVVPHVQEQGHNSLSLSLGLPSCLKLCFPLWLSYFIKAGGAQNSDLMQ